TNGVLPEPSSPEIVTTSPGTSAFARRAATSSVSAGELERISTTLEEAELNGRRVRAPGFGLELRLDFELRRLGHDGREAEQLRDPAKVLLQHREHRARVERRRRVVERVEHDLVAAEHHLLRNAVHARDPGR